MSTVTLNKDNVNPQFALFNIVFSSDSNELLTIHSVRNTLQKLGVEISNQEIEASFSKWRRRGMLHKQGEGFKIGSH